MDKEKGGEYRTVRGYENHKQAENLSTAMEDYLEMIARFCIEKGMARIGEISAALHVQPSSASKMVTKLKESGLVTVSSEKKINLTAEGKRIAEYLLYRHETIEQFLDIIGSEDSLKETELIEHFLSPVTVQALELITTDLEKNERLADDTE